MQEFNAQRRDVRRPNGQTKPENCGVDGRHQPVDQPAGREVLDHGAGGPHGPVVGANRRSSVAKAGGMPASNGKAVLSISLDSGGGVVTKTRDPKDSAICRARSWNAARSPLALRSGERASVESATTWASNSASTAGTRARALASRRSSKSARLVAALAAVNASL